MIFVDGIAMTRKFDRDVKPFVGTRRISYREAGDYDREGNPVGAQEVIGESITSAWIQGSHETRLSIKCDGRTLTMLGNPGRFGRADNLFNLCLDKTVQRANEVLQTLGYPADTFYRGEIMNYEDSYRLAVEQAKERGEEPPKPPEMRWTGARVWSIHLTENFETGCYENVRRVIDWANTQSVARVKKSRLGATTVVWGSIRYCQTEIYGKADEMLAHCKTKEDKDAMRQNPVYIHARERGIIRVEVKCAKDFLKERHLTYLGNWDMGIVESIFRERTEVLERCKLEVSENEGDWLEAIPRASRVHAIAWMQGIDVQSYMSRASFYRHAKVLREHGIDIAEKRNLAVIRPSMKSIPLEVATPPAWYQLAAA